MQIRKVSRSKTEGWYNVYFDGEERRWSLTNEESKDIDNDIEALNLPKCEVYSFFNDNGWYGFMNRDAIMLNMELTKLYNDSWFK